MRYLLYSVVALLGCLNWPTFSVHAQENEKTENAQEQVAAETLTAPVAITPELIQAHQEYMLAQLRLQQYRFAELPRQRRLLDDQVRLLESEIAVLKRQQEEDRSFLLAGRYSPIRRRADLGKLALQQAQQNLRLVKNERTNLMRFSRQNAQLYQLEVLRTAARVRALMVPVADTVPGNQK